MKLAISNTKTTSFTPYVNQHMDALRSYCLKLTKTPWDADDLVQETLLKAFKSWKKSPRDLSKAFFIRIASNTWIDQYRKRTLPIDANQDVHELLHEEDGMSVEAGRMISRVIKRLSPKQRAAMLLFEGFGMTTSEVAENLRISEGAVKACLHRARRSLAKMKEEGLDEFDDGLMTPYIDALRGEQPEKIVKLYQQETNTPMMGLSRQHSVVIGSEGKSYVLITLTLKNGKRLTIPFYRKEWLVLLAGIKDGNTSFALIA